MPSPPASQYWTALTTLQSQVAQNGWALSGVPLPVVIRKLPVREENLDPAAQIIVCPAEKPERWKRVAFGHWSVTMTSSVVIVAPNNGDFATNLQTFLGWRQTLAGQIGAGLGIAGLLKQDIEFDAPLDRGKLAEQYDYLSLGVTLDAWY